MKIQQYKNRMEAEQALRAQGFNVASAQRNAPQGLHRTSTVMKWRNLSLDDKFILDGVIFENSFGSVEAHIREDGDSWTTTFFKILGN